MFREPMCITFPRVSRMSNQRLPPTPWEPGAWLRIVSSQAFQLASANAAACICISGQIGKPGADFFSNRLCNVAPKVLPNADWFNHWLYFCFKRTELLTDSTTGHTVVPHNFLVPNDSVTGDCVVQQVLTYQVVADSTTLVILLK